ncbi:ABC transporter permease [Mesorhizobium sp. 2RAF21]|uniref:ABC transporter permease n=1 Tax=Mesorhizobium sp. 2RAF21 TaxID=3232995 RepID=UPI003F972E8C
MSRPALRWLSRLGVEGTLGLALTLAVVAIAAVGPFVTSQSPLDFVDAPLAPPSEFSWLGTDVLGRDVLARLLCGGWRILVGASVATAAGVFAGAFLGILAAYRRGWVDNVIMRLGDAVMAFPQIILVLLFVSLIGPQTWLILVMVAFSQIPSVARVARGAALRVVEEDHIRFCVVIGLPSRHIILREILPNLRTPLLVELGLRFVYSVVLIAALGFLGFGTQPPDADWGLMINENRIAMTSNPWPVVAPIVLIGCLAIGLNLCADALSRTDLR